MIPGVNVTEQNGLLGGVIGTNDNVTGVILTGAGTGVLGLLTPVKVVSVLDAAAKGIGLAAEPEATKFVTEFYSVPGTTGVPVYIMLAGNATSLVTLCDVTNANGIKRLTDFALGTIRVLGVSRTPAVGYVPTVSKFLDSDVFAAIPNAQAFAQAQFDAHTPVRVLLAGRVNDATNATIDVPKTQTANKVGIVVGSTLPDGLTSMGIILGRVAATAPHVCIGKNRLGALPNSAWYIGTQPILPDLSNPATVWWQQIDQLVDSGYITVKSYAQKAGLFIGNDPMCVAESDDYATLANGRVMDKASIIAYQTYIDEVNNEVDLDDNDLLEPVVIKALEAEIVNALKLNMSDSMSGDPDALIDGSQPIVSTSSLAVQVRVKPKGYTKKIDVLLGFNSPSN